MSFDAERFLRLPDPDCSPTEKLRRPSGILFIADSFHDLPWDTSCSTFAPARSACGAKDFKTGKIRLNNPLLSVVGRSIVRIDCDCRRSSKVSSLPPEMKHHHRFTEFERHRPAGFVIHRDFDGVAFAPSHRHAVRPVVNDVNCSGRVRPKRCIPARAGLWRRRLRYLLRRRSIRT
jgi:hypothetical protein